MVVYVSSCNRSTVYTPGTAESLVINSERCSVSETTTRALPSKTPSLDSKHGFSRNSYSPNFAIGWGRRGVASGIQA